MRVQNKSFLTHSKRFTVVTRLELLNANKKIRNKLSLDLNFLTKNSEIIFIKLLLKYLLLKNY